MHLLLERGLNGKMSLQRHELDRVRGLSDFKDDTSNRVTKHNTGYFCLIFRPTRGLPFDAKLNVNVTHSLKPQAASMRRWWKLLETLTRTKSVGRQ